MLQLLRTAFHGVMVAGVALSASPALAAEVGVTDDTILIGSHGPITGGATFLGLGGRDGAELAYKEINDAGGIHGRKLKMVFEDDGFSPSQGARRGEEAGRAGQSLHDHRHLRQQPDASGHARVPAPGEGPDLHHDSLGAGR